MTGDMGGDEETLAAFDGETGDVLVGRNLLIYGSCVRL